MTLRDRLIGVFYDDPGADRIVPRRGVGTWLVVLTTATMAFLAVFAIALAAAAIKAGQTWQTELAQSATVQILSEGPTRDQDTEATLHILETTPGVRSSRVLSDLEQRALLEPWFGRELPVDALALPRLIAIDTDPSSFDPQNLRLRLAGEVPRSRLDDHDRWRAPLETARRRLALVVVLALGLIATTLGAVTALAARAALATQTQVIDVLRLVGAKDGWIARAFVRRLTRRALVGAAAGTAVAALILLSFPDTGASGLPALKPSGAVWTSFAALPLLAAVTAFATTRASALRLLKGRP